MTPLRETIKVVSFDLDDTFWDCAPAIAYAEQVLFDWHREHTPRIFARHTLESLLEFRAAVRAEHPELAGCVSAMRMQALRQLLAEFNYSPTLAEQGFRIFYQARSQVSMYPGVLELLHSLKGRYLIAAITNGNADLALIGIDDYFDKIYAADLELKAKPHEDMFARCKDFFQIEGHQMLHIGDNPVTDVLGGIQAGVQTLWFNQHQNAWPDMESRPQWVASSISEIHELLA